MKNTITTLALLLFTAFSFAQENNFQLSSHILDVSKGTPAKGITIKLEKRNDETKLWSFVDEKITDANGRITDFLPNKKSNNGIYRLTYYTSDYFASNQTDSFYPFIEVVFQIKDQKHHHVPITLSAFGYSTYRGN